jgi:hypothetical protein
MSLTIEAFSENIGVRQTLLLHQRVAVVGQTVRQESAKPKNFWKSADLDKHVIFGQP